MAEVRYRRDGGSDQVGAVDAFTVTRWSGPQWHLTGLRTWSQRMLTDYWHSLAPDERPIHSSGQALTFATRADAHAFAEAAAERAR